MRAASLLWLRLLWLAQGTFFASCVQFTTDVTTLRDAVLQPLADQCTLVSSPNKDNVVGLLSSVQGLLEACYAMEQALFAGTAQHFLATSVCEVVASTLPILISALKLYVRWLRKAFSAFFGTGACVLPAVPLVAAHGWSTLDFILSPGSRLVALQALAERAVGSVIDFGTPSLRCDGHRHVAWNGVRLQRHCAAPAPPPPASP